jgi:hypothetical protein
MYAGMIWPVVSDFYLSRVFFFLICVMFELTSRKSEIKIGGCYLISSFLFNFVLVLNLTHDQLGILFGLMLIKSRGNCLMHV